MTTEAPFARRARETASTYLQRELDHEAFVEEARKALREHRITPEDYRYLVDTDAQRLGLRPA